MTGAALTADGDKRWVLSGVLDFSTVPATWQALEQLLTAGDAVTLSLADVTRSNSAGLVMLIEARDVARRAACRLSLVDIPRELLDLASMSQCETLITQNPG